MFGFNYQTIDYCGLVWEITHHSKEIKFRTKCLRTFWNHISLVNYELRMGTQHFGTLQLKLHCIRRWETLLTFQLFCSISLHVTKKTHAA